MAGIKGRGGQNRKSVAEHKEDGTYRANRHADLTDENAELIVPMIFKSDADIFNQIAQIILENKQGQQIDSLLIQQLVNMKIMYDQSLDVYNREGVDGAIGRRLASQVVAELGREVRVLLGELRLTPNTRIQTREDETMKVPKDSAEAAFHAKFNK